LRYFLGLISLHKKVMQLFYRAFSGMFVAIIEIFIIAFIAGILVRRDIIKRSYIQGLADITVKVLLPSMILDNILTTFDPSRIGSWWLLPMIGFLAPLVFLVFVFILYLPDYKKHLNKFPLATFQNGGYLVLPLGQLLYKERFNQFALYVFLLTMGLGMILWTVGKFLITHTDEGKKVKFTDLITPPFIAIVFSLFLVFTGLNKYIPKIIIEPIRLIGSATVPIATFVLGATVGGISFRGFASLVDIFKLSFVKYLIMPAITIFILYQSGFYISNSLLADFLVIESSAAPAANLIVMVRKYGGDEQQTGSIMFVMYFLAVITMPLTLALWKYITV